MAKTTAAQKMGEDAVALAAEAAMAVEVQRILATL